MDKVYLESSFISYLVSRPSKNLIVAAHQQITLDWWEYRKELFDCFISEAVLNEISEGDSNESRKRLEVIKNIPVLSIPRESEEIADLILKQGVLPKKAITDATHIAIASSHQVDFLLTWNCKHLANAQILKRLKNVLENKGIKIPLICTPTELLGDYNV